MTTQTNLSIVSPAEAHREALQAWREGQRQERITDFTQRLDDALLQAVERRALDIVATI